VAKSSQPAMSRNKSDQSPSEMAGAANNAKTVKGVMITIDIQARERTHQLYLCDFMAPIVGLLSLERGAFQRVAKPYHKSKS
jgi:hypothetical protein